MKIWKIIKEKLEGQPAKLKTAKLILQLGLTVKEDQKIYCGPVEVPAAKVAKALNLDRRTVKATAETILKNSELRNIYTNLTTAGPSLRNIAKHLGYAVIEIEANPSKSGIIAEVTGIIAERNISIRQIIAEDPELHPNPKLTIILEKQPPPEIIPKILKIETVKKITTY